VEHLEGFIHAWLPKRSFGFITTTGENSEQYFFHSQNSSVPLNSIAVGMKVTFDALPVKKGKNPTAINVNLADAPAEGGAL